MIDPNILKENPDVLEENIKRRNLDISINSLKKLDQARRKTRFDADETRAQQKKLSKEIPSLGGEEKEKALAEATLLSNEVKEKALEADAAEKNFMDVWVAIPNLIDTTSPDGNTEEDNKEISRETRSNLLTQ